MQYDDHCIIEFFGQCWRIAQVIPGAMLLVNDHRWTVMNFEDVNWAAYQFHARRMLQEKWGISLHGA